MLTNLDAIFFFRFVGQFQYYLLEMSPNTQKVTLMLPLMRRKLDQACLFPPKVILGSELDGDRHQVDF